MFTRLTPRLVPARALSLRPIHASALRLATGPVPTETPTKPATTQGHAQDKDGKDIQSEYVGSGQKQRDQASGSGENQPLDAARMDGGESKPAQGTGAFKDQVGGQPGGPTGSAGGMGKTEDAAGEGTGNKIKKALGVKSSRNFSTSARSYSAASSSSAEQDLSGARKPADLKVPGDQNPHLKHQSTGQDSGKGNAAPNPTLPSHNASKPKDNKGQRSSDPKTPGINETPSSGGKDADTKPSLNNAAIPTKPEGRGKAGFHTSARARTDAKYAGVHEGEAQKAGHNVPPEALPPKLSSAYNPAEATPAPPSNLIPSSDSNYSSTEKDLAHPVLTEKAKKGELSARNGQPSAELGRKGIDEAWKDIKP